MATIGFAMNAVALTVAQKASAAMEKCFLAEWTSEKLAFGVEVGS